MPMGRFLIPAVPFLCISAAFFITGSSAPSRLKRLWLLVVLNCTVALVSIKFDVLQFRLSHYVDVLTWENAHIRDWKLVGLWFSEHASPDQSLATGLGGIIPYYSGLRVIDRSGLNDRIIAEIIHGSEGGKPDKLWIDREIFKRKPTYILDESYSFDMLHLSSEIPESDWYRNSVFRISYQSRIGRIGNRYFIYYQRKE